MKGLRLHQQQAGCCGEQDGGGEACRKIWMDGERSGGDCFRFFLSASQAHIRQANGPCVCTCMAYFMLPWPVSYGASPSTTICSHPTIKLIGPRRHGVKYNPCSPRRSLHRPTRCAVSNPLYSSDELSSVLSSRHTSEDAVSRCWHRLLLHHHTLQRG